MSFFSSSAASAYKPQVRQEGFHLPSPAPSSTPPPAFDIFMPNGFLPDPFRKFPPHDPHAAALDFNDELASLMAPPHDRPQPPSHPPHNIFDVSAHHHNPPHYDPPHAFSPPHNFNSTLPALNSSMRYEPHPDPPPSSFHQHHQQQQQHQQFRQTPSPHDSSRSRSRSRPPPPPSSAPGPGGGVGPTRTSRARRNNSVSSASPPPPRPIVIPRTSASSVPSANQGQGVSWFIPSHSHHQSSEYSLPTPDSLHSHSLHALHPQQQQQQQQQHAFAPFGLPDTPAPVLPPVSSLPHAHHPHAHPKDPPHKPEDKQALLANEKRRRRRESHNAVERRRRDNINEKISELATLIPECMLDAGTTQIPTPTTPGALDDVLPTKKEDDAVEGGVVKANKGMILRKSVEYIRYLQQLVSAQGARNRDLERELKAYRGGSAAGGGGSGSPASSAGGGGDAMLLHDEFGFGAGLAAMGFGGLASMPEGEGGGEEMDVEGEGDGEGEDEEGEGDGEGSDGADVREREQEERGRRGRRVGGKKERVGGEAMET